jgi:hypothetical protein
MKLRILLSLSLLWLALLKGLAQSPADVFHDGAVNYLSNNIPKALEVVTNGRALFPDDIKLKKLEELLKQQNQQQQQTQDQKQQDQQHQKSEQSKDQQDQQKAQQSPGQQKDEQQADEQKGQEQQVVSGQMTPEEAKRLLDTHKGEEQVLQFRPEAKPRDPRRPFKDW